MPAVHPFEDTSVAEDKAGLHGGWCLDFVQADGTEGAGGRYGEDGQVGDGGDWRGMTAGGWQG